MRAWCTLRLQSASAVLDFDEDLAPLSHFTDPGITQELQNASAVLNSDEDLAPLSHFTDPGAPECERCAQPEKHGDGKRYLILVMLFRLLARYLLK